MKFLSNKDNKNLSLNVVTSLLIRGGGILVAFFTVPYYLQYFNDNNVLGVWFTILSVLTWVLTFDLGVGNGLRNHLTREISNNNKLECKKLISSAYVTLGILVVFFCVIYGLFSNVISWNDVFNIDTAILTKESLKKSVDISFYGVFLSFFLRLALSILYAIQKAAIPNLVNFVSHLLILLYLCVVTPSTNLNEAIVSLAIVHACATNIPLILTTIYIFSATILKECKPSLKYANKGSAKAVLSLGLAFLVIQILYMVISATNEWFISYYYSPEYSTDYQIYNKVFSFLGSLFMIAMTPVWSAITKALSERRFRWILRVQRLLYCVVGVLVILQITLIPLMPILTDIWLGRDAIIFEIQNEIWFIIYSTVFIWIVVQSTIASGINALKSQIYCYAFAVLCKIIGIHFLSMYFDNWVTVVAITSLSLLPYCLIQPIEIRKRLKQIMKQNEYDCI